MSCSSTEEVMAMEPLNDIIELHNATAKELGVDPALVQPLLDDLAKLLTGISLMKEVCSGLTVALRNDYSRIRWLNLFVVHSVVFR